MKAVSRSLNIHRIQDYVESRAYFYENKDVNG